MSQIRDARDKEWFWLDNEYLNGYAKHLGANCTVVYLSLCRYANNETQTCFPSMEKIATDNGIGSRNTVSRAIDKLQEWNIIEVKEEYDSKNKRRKNNIYTLLAKSEWKKKPCTKIEHGKAMHQNEHDPCTISDESHAPPVSSNNTNINNTNIKILNSEQSSQDIPLLIEEFKIVNPSYGKWYGNNTQRGACERMLKVHGIDYLRKIIALLPKTNRTAYMPTITTPLMLEDKMAQLVSGLEKIKNKKPVSRVI